MILNDPEAFPFILQRNQSSLSRPFINHSKDTRYYSKCILHHHRLLRKISECASLFPKKNTEIPLLHYLSSYQIKTMKNSESVRKPVPFSPCISKSNIRVPYGPFSLKFINGNTLSEVEGALLDFELHIQEFQIFPSQVYFLLVQIYSVRRNTQRI
ncbi:hypothetical protein CEXT_647661 [Caerostris extrusa]|uniref:Ribosomal protein L10 n=1 Tax=Caerostris extrusa TaxID=172846 RepID=A0AAV4NXM1_CAEEX|nr:hypothetical protein CEXT_647661 [Caerostris extrusa]